MKMKLYNRNIVRHECSAAVVCECYDEVVKEARYLSMAFIGIFELYPHCSSAFNHSGLLCFKALHLKHAL